MAKVIDATERFAQTRASRIITEALEAGVLMELAQVDSDLERWRNYHVCSPCEAGWHEAVEAQYQKKKERLSRKHALLT